MAALVLLVAGGALAWSASHYREQCTSELRQDNFVAAIGSCRVAAQLYQPFQWIRPQAYASALNDQGLAEYRQHRFPESGEHLRAALALYQRSEADGSANQATTLLNLGSLSGDLGDLRAQKQWNQQSVAMFDKHGLPCAVSAVRAAANLGLVMNALRESKDAALMLARRVERNKQCDQLNGRESALTLRVLGEAHSKNANYGDALASLDAGILQLRQAQAEQSLEMAYTLNTRAFVLNELNRPDEAEQDVRKALPILAGHFGGISVGEGTAHGILAAAQRRRGKPQEAEREYEEAERIYRRLLGNDHPRLAIILLYKASLLRSVGQRDKADLALREALRIRIAAFGKDSEQVADVNKALEDGGDIRNVH